MVEKGIIQLSQHISDFIEERDWAQFHSPKNLAIALSVEASELLEIFTWLKSTDSEFDDQKLTAIQDEVGDILIYLVDFCKHMDLDPLVCAFQKIKKNEKKYPIKKAKGVSTKYTEF